MSKDSQRSKESLSNGEPVLHAGRRAAVYKPSVAELNNRREVKGDVGLDANIGGLLLLRRNPTREEAIDTRAQAKQARESKGRPPKAANVTNYIGKVWRCSLTGKIHLRDDRSNDNDFIAVDLWERKTVAGKVDALVEDKYLFKASPMLYRTWLYHESSRRLVFPKSTDPNAMLRMILSQRCIDAPIAGGRWSPSAIAVLTCMCLALSADDVLIIVSIAWLAISSGISSLCNSPKRYRQLRAIFIIPRIAWQLLLFIRLIQSVSEKISFNVLGTVLAVILSIADWIMGDREVLNAFRFTCSYEIVKELPNRVFVCGRRGAADIHSTFGESPPVPYEVTGMGKWTHDLVLITDIMGIILELYPFSKVDLENMVNESAANSAITFHFWGLDCFNSDNPTMTFVEAQEVLSNMLEEKQLRSAFVLKELKDHLKSEEVEQKQPEFAQELS